MFLNPTILTGLAAAAVPLVIHWLARARFRSVDWAGMMFLDGSTPPQQQTAHLKGIVLLGMRMGIVGLLAVALAQPVLRTNSRDVRDPRASAVILLDRSASMAMDDNGPTRLDLAKEAVYQVLGDSGAGLRRKGDQVWLVLLGAPGEGAEAAVQTANDADPAQAIVTRLQALEPPTGEADVAAGLTAALDRLERAANASREIYLVCDRQALSWKGVDATFIDEFKKRIAAWPAPPSLFVIPVGSDSTDSVAIESVQLLDGPAIADQPAQIEVTLRNDGSIPRAGLPLELDVTTGSGNAQPRSQVTVNVPAHGSVGVRLPVTFGEAGSHRVTAELKRAPGIPRGKRMDRAVEVLDPLQTLIITGDERERTLRSSADFLRLALTPYHSPRHDGFRVDVVSAADWSGIELGNNQVVILADVAEVNPAQARALEAFVYDGGGLLIVPGDLTRAENYDEQLGRGGQGILPARLQPAVADSESATTTLTSFDLANPIFSFLRGRPDPAPSATVQRYFPAVPYRHSTSPAGYANGKPFLIESPPERTGRGRVLLTTTSLDAEATTLPLTGFFLPFVQSACRYLAGGARGPCAEPNLQPGQALRFEFGEPVDEKNINLRRRLPNGAWIDGGKLQVTQWGVRTEAQSAAALEPGSYMLQSHVGNHWSSTWAVVEAARSETDLTPLTDPQWRSLEQQLGFTRLNSTRRAIATAQAAARGGRPLWLVLLGAMIVLSLMELALARAWTRPASVVSRGQVVSAL